MKTFRLTHLADDVLVRDTRSLVATDRTTTALLIAHLAEIDRRKLYLPAGYPSMFEYCVEEFGMSEDQAWNRIEVARKGLEFPVLFEAIADGRLTLSAIRELGPHLSSSNAPELVEKASRLRRHELRVLLTHQFPRAEALRLDDGVVALRPAEAAERTGLTATDLSAHARIDLPAQQSVKPLSPNRIGLDFSVSQAIYARMRYFQSLVGVTTDLESTFGRAIEGGIREAERQKFGGSTRLRNRDHRSGNPRYVAMDVRRTVWMRDEGRCTFVGPTGHRCTVTGAVEFDHIEPVARGGKATAENIRLLCRAHNQYEAERLMGSDFMERKRERRERFEDVAAAMRTLRARPAEARLAAEHAMSTTPDGTLEEQIKAALKWFRPRTTKTTTTDTPAKPATPATDVTTKPATTARTPEELVPA